jgi:uncharacterized protein YqeY
MANYNEEFVTIHGEMLKQVRDAVANLANSNYSELPDSVQQSIHILTGAFGYRIGAAIPERKNAVIVDSKD